MAGGVATLERAAAVTPLAAAEVGGGSASSMRRRAIASRTRRPGLTKCTRPSELGSTAGVMDALFCA